MYASYFVICQPSIIRIAFKILYCRFAVCSLDFSLSVRLKSNFFGLFVLLFLLSLSLSLLIYQIKSRNGPTTFFDSGEGFINFESTT